MAVQCFRMGRYFIHSGSLRWFYESPQAIVPLFALRGVGLVPLILSRPPPTRNSLEQVFFRPFLFLRIVHFLAALLAADLFLLATSKHRRSTSAASSPVIFSLPFWKVAFFNYDEPVGVFFRFGHLLALTCLLRLRVFFRECVGKLFVFSLLLFFLVIGVLDIGMPPGPKTLPLSDSSAFLQAPFSFSFMLLPLFLNFECVLSSLRRQLPLFSLPFSLFLWLGTFLFSVLP